MPSRTKIVSPKNPKIRKIRSKIEILLCFKVDVRVKIFSPLKPLLTIADKIKKSIVHPTQTRNPIIPVMLSLFTN